jgi:Chromo (CHRromatin Organisation MOdifier) domain
MKVEEADEADDFVVEKICGVREYRGDTQYLVKWEGYEDGSNSWIKVQNLNCPRLIAKFTRASHLT